MMQRFATALILMGGLFGAGIAAPVSIAQPAVIDQTARDSFKNSIQQTGGPAKDDLASKIKSVVDLLLYLAGTVAVIVIIIAGIRFVTSDGDPGKADKARNTVIYAVIGLVIAVAAFAIVNFVLDRFA